VKKRPALAQFDEPLYHELGDFAEASRIEKENPFPQGITIHSEPPCRVIRMLRKAA
jgi:hypothetical protein